MTVVAIASCFGFLVLVAVLAFAVAEEIRSQQRREVAAFVARRAHALARRREERKRAAQEEALRQEKAAKRRKSPFQDLPADGKIASDLALVEKVARETPAVFAKVIRWCVHNDPAVVAGSKRASVAEDFDRPAAGAPAAGE